MLLLFKIILNYTEKNISKKLTVKSSDGSRFIYLLVYYIYVIGIK